MARGTNAFDTLTEWATTELRQRSSQPNGLTEKDAIVACIIGIANITVEAGRFKWTDKTLANIRRYHEQFNGARHAPASKQRQGFLSVPAI